MKVIIQPEERDLSGIIEVLKANINAPRGGPFQPDTCLTKGEMAFLVEILTRIEKKKSSP